MESRSPTHGQHQGRFACRVALTFLCMCLLLSPRAFAQGAGPGKGLPDLYNSLVSQMDLDQYLIPIGYGPLQYHSDWETWIVDESKMVEGVDAKDYADLDDFVQVRTYELKVHESHLDIELVQRGMNAPAAMAQVSWITPRTKVPTLLVLTASSAPGTDLYCSWQFFEQVKGKWRVCKRELFPAVSIADFFPVGMPIPAVLEHHAAAPILLIGDAPFKLGLQAVPSPRLDCQNQSEPVEGLDAAQIQAICKELEQLDKLPRSYHWSTRKGGRFVKD